eukprot:TRINITY_DN48111_c0_g1_i1.p1 TRINITY_DN48111_c0_g1~~TRINITY_DN48111_c0_g1_i1.p1  ORF type:complete len:453 (-),score=97.25 TRINITY_DN48111_c0_g1_i1:27-1385(-)
MERGQTESVLATQLRNRGFQVVEPLKCAGHATIFRVCEREDPPSESFVAKVVCLEGLDAQGQAGAQQEVSLLKGLSAHPNLIAYRESFLVNAGILFIVMSLAEDGDLRRVVTEAQAVKRVLPEPAVLTWIRQTLLGLEHLHNQGVVHRDLKSSNIFLCEGRRRIRIGDFGISTVLQSTAFASSCVGTPAYMSPELMRNERYDYHVDMWALGCICFELSTLSMPFSSNSLLQLATQIMEQSPVWELMQGRSEELTSVCNWLLQKDVANRPTAREVLQQPLFAEGGRASIGPTDEEWASLAEGELHRTPEKRRAQTTVSTTALSGSDSLESKVWTTTPRMAWETSSRASESTTVSPGGLASSAGASTMGTAAASGSFDRVRQRAQNAHQELSKDEFAAVLSTHEEALLAQLRSSGSQQSGSHFEASSGYSSREAEAHERHIQRNEERVVAETVM